MQPENENGQKALRSSGTISQMTNEK